MLYCAVLGYASGNTGHLCTTWLLCICLVLPYTPITRSSHTMLCYAILCCSMRLVIPDTSVLLHGSSVSVWYYRPSLCFVLCCAVLCYCVVVLRVACCVAMCYMCPVLPYTLALIVIVYICPTRAYMHSVEHNVQQ